MLYFFINYQLSTHLALLEPFPGSWCWNPEHIIQQLETAGMWYQHISELGHFQKFPLLLKNVILKIHVSVFTSLFYIKEPVLTSVQTSEDLAGSLVSLWLQRTMSKNVCVLIISAAPVLCSHWLDCKLIFLKNAQIEIPTCKGYRLLCLPIG